MVGNIIQAFSTPYYKVAVHLNGVIKPVHYISFYIVVEVYQHISAKDDIELLVWDSIGAQIKSFEFYQRITGQFLFLEFQFCRIIAYF